MVPVISWLIFISLRILPSSISFFLNFLSHIHYSLDYRFFSLSYCTYLGFFFLFWRVCLSFLGLWLKRNMWTSPLILDNWLLRGLVCFGLFYSVFHHKIPLAFFFFSFRAHPFHTIVFLFSGFQSSLDPLRLSMGSSRKDWFFDKKRWTIGIYRQRNGQTRKGPFSKSDHDDNSQRLIRCRKNVKKAFDEYQ